MNKKTFKLIKENPVIILFYTAYLLVIMFIILLFYPKNLNQLGSYAYYDSFNLATYFMAMIKLLMAVLLMVIVQLLFIPGFNYLITEAIRKGKTSAEDFFPGLKKFFVRTLLAMLLLTAFGIGFVLVASIITIPFTILLMLSGTLAIHLINININIIIILIFCTLMLFAAPFIILWIPSIFIDDVGVMKGLTNGAKVAAKNYWRLVLILLIAGIPTILYSTVISASGMPVDLISPSYFLFLLISGLISVIVRIVLYMVYFEKRQRRTENQYKMRAQGNQSQDNI